MSLALTYIYHDGFLLQTPVANVVFDYWMDPDSAEPGFLRELDVRKPLYVLVTHHHKDHYNPEIFQWAARFGKIRYILSRDTFRAARHFFAPTSLYKGARRVDSDLITCMSPGDVYDDGVVRISAFGSTDIGNSYMVEIDGRKVFHAGDLNAWIWKDESTPAEIAGALAQFGKILSSIKTCTDGFDLAMFPVDPRLGTDFWTGAAIFVRRFDVKTFVPMHFTLAGQPDRQLDYMAAAGNFATYANPDRGEYVILTTPGAEWLKEP